MTGELRAGLMLGYWAARPLRRTPARPARRGARVRVRLDRRGVRLRRALAAGVVGGAHVADRARYRTDAAVGADARVHGHDRGHDGPPLRGPVRARARCVAVRRWSRGGTASRSPSRWLARVSTCRILRDVWAREGPVTSDGAALPAAVPGRRGARQAAEDHHPPETVRHPGAARRGGAEERRARGRDRRRVAARSSTPRSGRIDVRRLARRRYPRASASPAR